MPVIAGCACRAILFCCLVTGEREALWKHERKRERESSTAHTWAEDLRNCCLFQVGFKRSLDQGSPSFFCLLVCLFSFRKPSRLFSGARISWLSSFFFFKPCLKSASFGHRNAPSLCCTSLNAEGVFPSEQCAGRAVAKQTAAFWTDPLSSSRWCLSQRYFQSPNAPAVPGLPKCYALQRKQ